MLPSLPDDVISEILTWVPVKHACRFQCVSRGWRTLISSPAFLAAHKNRGDPLLLSVTTSVPPKISSVSRLMDIDGTIIKSVKEVDFWPLNCCFEGPVCVCFISHFVFVIDFTTGNVVRTSAEVNHELCFSLGVGCSVPSRTYKVVSFARKYDPCKILTLEDGARWRRVQSPPIPSQVTNGYKQGSPVTVNGVMHFLYKVVMPQVDEDCVLSFDLESEEWQACIKLPTRSGDKLHDCKYMAKLNDTLCMVQKSSVNEYLIWGLTDSVKGTWVKLYTIPMAQNFDSLRPLTVIRDGRKLLVYAFNSLKATPTLQVYNPLTGTCTCLTKFGRNLLGNAGVCVVHLECFISPKILPVSAPSVMSQLISFHWLRQLNPLSLFCK